MLVASLAAVFAAFAGLAGCGQRGPLVLPDSARPIERLDGLALPDAEPGTSTPAAGEPDLDEDEAENEEPARQ